MRTKSKAGDRHNKLVIVGFTDSKSGQKIAVCKCDCGTEKAIRLHHVTSGVTVSCGCVKRKHTVTPGGRYGRLVALDEPEILDHGYHRRLFKCDCGTEKWISAIWVATGVTKSCGCLVADQAAKLAYRHGLEQHPAYKIWVGMRERCLNPKSKSYKNYGGRGITISDAWAHDVKAFCEWADANGHAPGLEIDRRDNNGNYEPGNCWFITQQANCRNRRSNVRVTAYGESKILKEWSEDSRCAVGYEVLRVRISKGVNPELAMTMPPKPGRKLCRMQNLKETSQKS